MLFEIFGTSCTKCRMHVTTMSAILGHSSGCGFQQGRWEVYDLGLGIGSSCSTKVSVMEEVDALIEASSYSIFLEVVRWAGCRIVARKCVNLGDLLLQNWNRPVKMGS